MFEIVLYVVLLMLGGGTLIWSSMELIKILCGRADYYITDITLNGSLGQTVNAAMLTNLVRLRIAEIREDLKQSTGGAQNRSVVLSSNPLRKDIKIPAWASIATPAVENKIGDLKLSVGGFDLGGLLTWLRSNIVSSRTLRFAVTVNESAVVISGDVGMFDWRRPSLQIEVLKRQSPEGIVASLIADRIGCEVVRRQILGSDPRNIWERVTGQKTQRITERDELDQYGPAAFRTTLFTDSTRTRAERSGSIAQALQDLQGQMDYAWEYLTRLFTIVETPSVQIPNRPSLQLLPDDSPAAYVDYILDKPGNPELFTTTYEVVPMARFVPDKTFGGMGFIFIAELKRGALRRMGNSAWEGESGAILSSYIDILGAVVKKQWLGEESNGPHWPLIQEGGIDLRNGIDLSISSTAVRKPIRSLKMPGSCDGDHQIAQWHLHSDGDDLINGVHQNSGILNKAFYDASQNVGAELTAEIWLRGLQNALPDDWSELKAHPLKIEQVALAISSNAGDKKREVDKALQGVGLQVALGQ